MANEREVLLYRQQVCHRSGVGRPHLVDDLGLNDGLVVGVIGKPQVQHIPLIARFLGGFHDCDHARVVRQIAVQSCRIPAIMPRSARSR
jgi:hypothetical protein